MGRPVQPGAQQEDSAACEQQVNEWKQVLEDGDMEVTADVEAFLKWYYTQKRTAYTMDVQPAAESLGLKSSKLGGLPFLLPGEPWPVSTEESKRPNRELTFIWQLRVDEMPAEAQQLLGVHEGLLQFFLDMELPGYDINEHRGYYLVRVITAEQLNGSHTNHETPSTVEVLPEKVVAGWVPHSDFPGQEDACERGKHLLDEVIISDLVDTLEGGNEDTGCVGGDKLLGWPRWVQSPEWGTTEEGQEYLQLFQFQAEHLDVWTVGDGGMLVIQCHPSEPTINFKVGWAAH